MDDDEGLDNEGADGDADDSDEEGPQEVRKNKGRTGEKKRKQRGEGKIQPEEKPVKKAARGKGKL